MLNLLIASAYFLLIHFGVSGTRLRPALVARIGEGAYRGAFSLALERWALPDSSRSPTCCCFTKRIWD